MTRIEFHSVILGGGPAGTGPLVQAVQTGEFDRLLAKGIAVVDRGETLCGGAMVNYRILSNTYGKSFLECLDGADSERVLGEVRKTAAAHELEASRESLLPLAPVGRFLLELGKPLADRLDASDTSRFFRRHEARRVRREADGSFVTTLDDLSSGRHVELRSPSVVFAMGGHQRTSERFADELAALAQARSLPVPPCLLTENIVSRNGPSDVQRALGGIAKPRIVILGASHSAFSAAWVLLHLDGIEFAPGGIEMLHANRVKLFYDTREAARAAGYEEWDEDDVCPLTQRVFRLGGLRGDARELYRRVRGWSSRGSAPRIRMRKVERSDAGRRSMLEAALDADLVIPAFGYRPRTVAVTDHDGSDIALAGQGRRPMVDGSCRVLDDGGNPIDGLYAVGLGSGFRPSGELGGEASFVGQTNGLWLYQNGIGRLVLDHIA